MRGAMRAWASVMARQSGCCVAGGSICSAALIFASDYYNCTPNQVAKVSSRAKLRRREPRNLDALLRDLVLDAARESATLTCNPSAETREPYSALPCAKEDYHHGGFR